jgi:hypothetical protein
MQADERWRAHLDDHRRVKAVHTPVVELEREARREVDDRQPDQPDVQEVPRDRPDPREVGERTLHLERSVLDLLTRLEDPTLRDRLRVVREVVEEVLEGLLAGEEVTPGFLEGGEKPGYAREM